MLDLLVGGCTIFVTQQVSPKQPDTVDTSVAQPGSGGPYKLSADSTHTVIACRDNTNQTVNLQACLDAATYSSFFKFAAERVILK
jgi:hypothetical protein